MMYEEIKKYIGNWRNYIFLLIISVVVIVAAGVVVAVLMVTKTSSYDLFQCFSASGLWTTAKCSDIVTMGKFYSLLFFERCCAVWSGRSLLQFQRNVLSPSWGSKSKSSKQSFYSSRYTLQRGASRTIYIFPVLLCRNTNWEYSILVIMGFFFILI